MFMQRYSCALSRALAILGRNRGKACMFPKEGSRALDEALYLQHSFYLNGKLLILDPILPIDRIMTSAFLDVLVVRCSC